MHTRIATYSRAASSRSTGRFLRRVGNWLLILVLAGRAIAAATPPCPIKYNKKIEIYPTPPLRYPMTSDQYSVEYQITPVSAASGADENSGAEATGGWETPRVYMTTYGGTNASPFETYSLYQPDATSMSFVSIPAAANVFVTVRVKMLTGPPLSAGGPVSLRPSAKDFHLDWVSGYTAQFSRKTGEDFAGEQFVLWWEGLPASYHSSSIEGLAIFLDPPYPKPTVGVKTVRHWSELKGVDLTPFQALDFEGDVVLGDATPTQAEGALAFEVPANITEVYLGPGAWVQGKLRFDQTGKGAKRTIEGPGVLDTSRFNYSYRQCRDDATYAEQGYETISWVPLAATTTGTPPADRFFVNGVVLTDGNYYATDMITDGNVNNLKILSWNGNNDGLEMGDDTKATNVFVRAGDDSLKMWGQGITVKNATVWQNYNGGVVNLGWSNKYTGDGNLVDGLYVVETDWYAPTTAEWMAQTLEGQLDHQNNAVIDSMMTPDTQYGTVTPPLFENIYVEDPPQVLFSLKILPTDCGLVGLSGCPPQDFTAKSALNLTLEHVYSPKSLAPNSIGFQYVDTKGYKGWLTGCMAVGLTDVEIEKGGTVDILDETNGFSDGNISTKGLNVLIDFGKEVIPCSQAF